MTTELTTSAFASETTDVWLILLTIDHADLSTPILIVNNTENITSGGDEYVGAPFDIQLPDQREDSPPTGRIVFDNVSQEIAQAIRTITTPATVQIEIIRAADPDTIEKSLPYFVARNVRWNAGKVTVDLFLEDLTREPFPKGIFSPSAFPGLF